MNPERYMESGSGNAVDYRVGKDTSGPPNNWRRPTPPPGEDGTVPDLRFTVTDQVDVATGPGVLLPLYPSTFDIPDSQWG
jgi:hypothetical protein